MKKIKVIFTMLLLSGALTACGFIPPNDTPCLSDDDCGAGAKCQQEQCVISQSSEVPGTKSPDKPARQATTCSADSDCKDGQICNTERNVCRKQCQSDADCQNGTCDTSTQMCKRNRPAPTKCQSDSDCRSGQACDAAEGVCKRPSCQQDADCFDGMQCNQERNVCYKPCQADSDCSEGLICNERSNSCTRARSNE